MPRWLWIVDLIPCHIATLGPSAPKNDIRLDIFPTHALTPPSMHLKVQLTIQKQKVLLLCTSKSPHKLKLAMKHIYNPNSSVGPVDLAMIAASSSPSSAAMPLFFVRITPSAICAPTKALK